MLLSAIIRSSFLAFTLVNFVHLLLLKCVVKSYLVAKHLQSRLFFIHILC